MISPALRSRLRSINRHPLARCLTPGLSEAIVEYRAIPSPAYGDMTRVARKHNVNRKTLHHALYRARWAR